MYLAFLLLIVAGELWAVGKDL